MSFINNQTKNNKFFILTVNMINNDKPTFMIKVLQEEPEGIIANVEAFFIDEILKLDSKIYKHTSYPDSKKENLDGLLTFLNNQSNEIAHSTRRGAGNYIIAREKIINQLKNNVISLFDFCDYEINNQIPENKVIMLYKGKNSTEIEMDGPFFKNNITNAYAFHPQWKDFVRVVTIED